MTKNLPAPRAPKYDISALTGAQSQVGSGSDGGTRFLTIKHKTGDWFIGKEEEPFDFDAEWALMIEEFRYGYYYFEGKGAPDKGNMVPMISGKPKPIPNEPYTTYPDDGPRDMVEIRLHPVAGGEPVEFAPTGVSSQNRVGNLWGAIVNQAQTPEGQLGFVNPIIKGKPNSWDGSYGVTHHFDFKIVDWTDASGEVRLSEYQSRGIENQSPSAGAGARMADDERHADTGQERYSTSPDALGGDDDDLFA